MKGVSSDKIEIEKEEERIDEMVESSDKGSNDDK